MAIRTSKVLQDVERILKNDKNKTSEQALDEVIREGNLQFSRRDRNTLMSMLRGLHNR